MTTATQIPIELIRSALLTVGVTATAADRYRPMAEKVAGEASGRTLRIDGPIISATGEKIDQLIFGDSIGTGPNAVADFLAEAGGEDVTFLINSPGGSASACADICSQIEMYPGKACAKIVGDAASAASLIAAVCDEVQIGPLSMVMIHSAWTTCVGNAVALRKEAEVLDKLADGFLDLYAKRMDRETVAGWLKDGDDHWMSAGEAIKAGFADSKLSTAKAGDADTPDGDKADGDDDDKDAQKRDAGATPADRSADAEPPAGDTPGDGDAEPPADADDPAGDTPGEDDPVIDDGDTGDADGDGDDPDPDEPPVPASPPASAAGRKSLLLNLAQSNLPRFSGGQNGTTL